MYPSVQAYLSPVSLHFVFPAWTAFVCLFVNLLICTSLCLHFCLQYLFFCAACWEIKVHHNTCRHRENVVCHKRTLHFEPRSITTGLDLSASMVRIKQMTLQKYWILTFFNTTRTINRVCQPSLVQHCYKLCFAVNRSNCLWVKLSALPGMVVFLLKIWSFETFASILWS